MEQPAALMANEPAVGSLLRLVTGHLASPMGTLTLHESARGEADLLAAFNMPALMASQLAAQVHDDLGRDAQMHDGVRASSPEKDAASPEHMARVTFVCRVEPTISLALSACREANGWDAQEPRAIESWVDLHLRLLWQMQREQLRSRVFSQSLDLFDFGMVLLDRHGAVHFANSRATALLDHGDGLRRAGNSITVPDFDAAVRMQAAIQHLGQCIETGAQPDFGRACVILIRRPDGRALIATLTHIAATQQGQDDGAILLFLLDPDIDAQPMVAALCRAYGLTATEASLVQHLVHGSTIEKAAKLMRIQPLTARAYLKQIFIKTGTHRQVDLVRTILKSVVRMG
ncbi:hypothetical protein [Sphingomonas sp. C3-2]|uniref:helix-turn-helix transcriptional regulator n=1 Tax=Sphingomonas sp. C3-2 TaxID=3062169 RepID=UPI00294ABA51|nr:hypothetical protein [Sphingomonas sp. C3-2]WOK35929.1 hypothetical protein QYC26_13085 [Sphingomonas sp. C3-2]